MEKDLNAHLQEIQSKMDDFADCLLGPDMKEQRRKDYFDPLGMQFDSIKYALKKMHDTQIEIRIYLGVIALVAVAHVWRHW